MASKKMKYASMAGVGLMTMSLVACANPDEQGYIGDSFETQEAMQSNGIKTISQSQFDGKCEEYELQPDGSYMCDDDGYTGSGAGMFWFFNGHTYSSHSAMVASSDYKKHNLKTGTSIPTETKNKLFNTDARKNSKLTKGNNKNNTGGSNNPKSGSSGKSSGFGGGARGGSSGGS